MKKIVLTVIVCILTISLAACSNNENNLIEENKPVVDFSENIEKNDVVAEDNTIVKLEKRKEANSKTYTSISNYKDGMYITVDGKKVDILNPKLSEFEAAGYKIKGEVQVQDLKAMEKIITSAEITPDGQKVDSFENLYIKVSDHGEEKGIYLDIFSPLEYAKTEKLDDYAEKILFAGELSPYASYESFKTVYGDSYGESEYQLTYFDKSGNGGWGTEDIQVIYNFVDDEINNERWLGYVTIYNKYSTMKEFLNN